MPSEPVRIALLNDYDVVVHGVRSMLEPYRDRVVVVEMDLQVPVARKVDIALYDTFSQAQVDTADLDGLLADETNGAVAIYTWNMQPDLAEQALRKGCRGYLGKSLSSVELVEALEAIAQGETIVAGTDMGPQEPIPLRPEALKWPGADAGLTPRESEVLALITQGLTNADIASRSYLSINSVKSYIRSAYRKIGVERRSQAVRWGLENGMLPDVGRVVGL
ncbi:DNA-binding response regulator [Tessaracoccus flavus]|uniref:Helix-turn-helix transcriptional regulator n=1 Tax=Tessaracoccus flavus TaxID=1610493 RepID=A0A1Q2CEW7_9ACTN|nr:response regulator transcription factor [Tessaracoccus flavus]AQP44595.1 helix-turn-helix transcriptional regulator [Tessaracoccus flavus]